MEARATLVWDLRSHLQVLLCYLLQLKLLLRPNNSMPLPWSIGSLQHTFERWLLLVHRLQILDILDLLLLHKLHINGVKLLL